MQWTRSLRIRSSRIIQCCRERTRSGDPNIENKYTRDLPEVHMALKGLRSVANKYNAVFIGETCTDNVDATEGNIYRAHDMTNCKCRWI